MVMLTGPEACRACGMWRNSKSICVPGEGPRPCRLLLVGQSLGAEEEEYGANFIGPAGKMLNSCLREANVLRADCGVTNANKCRPVYPKTGRNRAPTVEEIEYCQAWLDPEIAEYQPRIILALGAEAADATWGLTGSVLTQMGRVVWSERYRTWVIPTIHPSFVLHKPGMRSWLVRHITKAWRR